MRKFGDRIRHALSFEIIALLLVTPLGALIFHMPMEHIGVVTLVSATLATGWNFLYNYLFDLTLQKTSGSTAKRGYVRILHAILFETGLLIVLLPFIAWYLGVTIWQAFIMDIAFALFYMIYAYVFNWGYDRMFPLPEWSVKPAE